MNEQQVNELLIAMSAQTAAINRLAESNETLSAMIYQTMVAEDNESDMPQVTYLSGKPKR